MNQMSLIFVEDQWNWNNFDGNRCFTLSLRTYACGISALPFFHIPSFLTLNVICHHFERNAYVKMWCYYSYLFLLLLFCSIWSNAIHVSVKKNFNLQMCIICTFSQRITSCAIELIDMEQFSITLHICSLVFRVSCVDCRHLKRNMKNSSFKMMI